MSGGSTWRSRSTAADFASHDYADFAQEYLRRNEGYSDDHGATERRIAKQPASAKNEREGLARRWGLSFPCSARGTTRRSSGTLVARAPRHHHPD
ncbi:MAG: hypothetical protein C0429_09355 [Sphingopyxis sp.]|jgi:hypothetical protein|nr:hypothetical protein [Sphingopyxis sp.]